MLELKDMIMVSCTDAVLEIRKARGTMYRWLMLVLNVLLLPGLYSVFSSKEALQEYAVSEAHVKVVTDHVKPNIDGMYYTY